MDEQRLAFLVADIISEGIADTMVDMYIWFTPVRITSQHKQVIYTSVTQTINRTDNNFQYFLRLEVLKIVDGFYV